MVFLPHGHDLDARDETGASAASAPGGDCGNGFSIAGSS
jgi:hypothetical protein